jgi:FlaG/FlaF family flagellin (archaellin)
MKGISPLLAGVLIIAVTVSIATLVMGWISTLTKSTQASVENKTAEAVDCSSAAIIIDPDSVFVTAGSSGTVRATVRNSGFTDLTLITAQVYNSTGYNFTITSPSFPLSQFNVGSLQTISFDNTSIAVCPGSFSRIVVTTNCGGETAIFDKSPKCV